MVVAQNGDTEIPALEVKTDTAEEIDPPEIGKEVELGAEIERGQEAPERGRKETIEVVLITGGGIGGKSLDSIHHQRITSLQRALWLQLLV